MTCTQQSHRYRPWQPALLLSLLMASAAHGGHVPGVGECEVFQIRHGADASPSVKIRTT